ncbi:TIGR03503 family protein [Vibrionales bacterium C3R12]|uniref:TIGR03503 family protein n=1 Tax=Vibrio cortegadensis TaxID=1328770 RepID=UPI000DE97759|nr:TIGR03503 family protein [Vibrio cortegadensis]MDN3698825.1 TIGR03503 family protein [Vibrio cortegadensis]RBW64117.1 TIGR03503 family protein [Vibrionales bacterium C3R12]
MLRIFATFSLLLVTLSAWATPESSMSLLDNRFRVDPTIEQITFVIYRAKDSQPVVLVRPDGKKYYSWRSPDSVRWYQESSMDIISIDKPMAGPWQAVGQVSPKNNIKLLSHLTLGTDRFPNRLYKTEFLKFTAQLKTGDKPLVLRDFLDRVKLKVTFTKFIENEDELVKEARPIPIVVGEFLDDGKQLDEKAGDGVFTVGLPIEVEPGKYRVRVTSGNGVFLRAQESTVLVYPSPISTTFIQSRKEGVDHNIVISGEQGMIAPGTIAAHIEQLTPTDLINYVEGQAEKEAFKVSLMLENHLELGKYSWNGRIFATDAATQRGLVFPISEQTYSVVKDVDIEESRRLQEEALAAQKKIEMEQQMLAAREAARQKSMMVIAIGNVVVIILGLLVWFVIGKIRAKKAALPEMQLAAPKK